MNRIIDYLINRLKEKTTWAGFMLVLAAFGIHLTVEQQFAISFLGMALAGAPSDVFQRMRNKNIVQDVIEEQPKIEEIKNADKKKSLDAILDDDSRLD